MLKHSDWIGKHHTEPLLENRLPIVDVLEIFRKKHYVSALLELDITTARQWVKDYRKQTGKGLSLFAYIVAAIGRAVAQHPVVHAVKKGRKLVFFEDIDVCIQVEKNIGEKRVPLPYVIRKVSRLNLKDLHEEIEHAKAYHMSPDDVALQERLNKPYYRLYKYLPGFLRRLFWKRLSSNPFMTKKISGTVGITSLSRFGKGTAWAVPIPTLPLVLAMGGTDRKPGAVGEKIELRDFLCLTVMFDHDVVDGAPAARFLATLKKEIEGRKVGR